MNVNLQINGLVTLLLSNRTNIFYIKAETMKTPSRGRLYVFEGPDNVGKTTIAKSVANLLSKTEKTQYLSFPGSMPHSIGELVYELHHKTDTLGIDAIDKTSLQALHVAAHIDSIKRIIIPLLSNGISIILDRYWWSTVVYSEFNDCDMDVVKQLVEAEKIAWGEVSPVAIFHISRGFPCAGSTETHQKLTQLYQAIASNQKDVVLVIDIKNSDLTETIAKIYKTITTRPDQSLVSSSLEQAYLFSKPKTYTERKTFPPSSLERLLSPTVVFDTYWEFAVKRQNIFFARLRGDKKPWTDDPILNDHKFTNAYRASDRVSQFLIKNVIYNGSQDVQEVFFRTILFKLFNKIETWELLDKSLNGISFAAFDFDLYDSILTKAIENNNRIYSAAYIMPTGGSGTKYKRKHRMHLDLLRMMMKDELPLKISDAKSMGKVFDMLRAYPGIGDFLAYQYTTDINYSEITNFSEKQFVVPGPGAKDGIRKCFEKTGGLSDAEIIKVVMESQDEEFDRLELNFKSLWGRSLRLIDCQNLFCETDKYARVKHPEIKGITGRSRIKQKFTPNPQPINYWYPPKWGINEMIQAGEAP